MITLGRPDPSDFTLPFFVLDILAFISSDNLTPFLRAEILAFLSSVHAIDILIFVSSESRCPNEDPALAKILYSGRIKSKKYCSLIIA
jgi:hypothetical protein